MRRIITIACALAIVSGGLGAQQTGAPSPVASPAQAAKKPHASKKKAASAIDKNEVKAAAPVTPAPVAPARAAAAAMSAPALPATLMNRTPVSPEVTIKDGLLTIDAPNSNLNDVLKGVEKATGATVEGATPTERIAVRLGPGEPRQVIAALLQGTPYDYVILGSQENQDAVTRILLTQSTGGASPQNASAAGRQAQVAWQPQPAAPENPPERIDPDVDAATNPQPAGEVETDPSAQSQPQQPQTNQGQPNTPEELFKQLQPHPQPAQQ